MKLKNEQEIREMVELAPVNGFDNYLASKDGFILNKKTNRVIRGSINKRGYVRVFLSKKGYSKNLPYHRVILESFIPRPSSDHEVNHINFNKSDNRLINLEWVTRKDNILHNYSGNKIRRGEGINLAKLDDIQVLTIITLRKKKEFNGCVMARLYGVHHTTIQRIRKGKLWNHLYQLVA